MAAPDDTRRTPVVTVSRGDSGSSSEVAAVAAPQPSRHGGHSQLCDDTVTADVVTVSQPSGVMLSVTAAVTPCDI